MSGNERLIKEPTARELARDAIETLEREAEGTEDEMEAEVLWMAARHLRLKYGFGLGEGD